jgi:hypothetical protein
VLDVHERSALLAVTLKLGPDAQVQPNPETSVSMTTMEMRTGRSSI